MNPSRRCPKCGAQLGAGDRFCPGCGTLQSGGASPAVPARPQLPLLALPAGVTARVEGDALVISWRWYHVGYAVGIGFAVALAAFWGWVTWQDHHDPTSSGTITSFLGVFLWPAFACLLYWMLAGVCNTTVIAAHPGRIRQSTGPIFWLGGKVKSAEDLAELETIQQVHKAGIWQGSVDYAIAAKTIDKRRWWLGGTIRTPDIADYIAEAVGGRYGVPVKTFRGKMRERLQASRVGRVAE